MEDHRFIVQAEFASDFLAGSSGRARGEEIVDDSIGRSMPNSSRFRV